MQELSSLCARETRKMVILFLIWFTYCFSFIHSVEAKSGEGFKIIIEKQVEDAENSIGHRINEGMYDRACSLDGMRTCANKTNNVFMYWHIPKSGGTTMWALFSKYFRTPFVRCSTEEDARQWQQRKSEIENLHPHLALGASLETMMLLPDQHDTFILMGMFRDPVELRKSLYFYRKHPPPSEQNQKTTANLTVAEFLSVEHKDLSMTNFLCACLSGTPQEFGHYFTEKHLVAAQAKIPKIFVMLLSDFGHGIKMLSDMLGWKIYGDLNHAISEKHNVGTHSSQELSGEDLELIRKVNWCDVKLYESILEQYEKVKQAHSHHFGRRADL
mmetsp:Transcript_21378/g.27640  ORF Transcript_21378/g.27640 Transcript_21378/m.27640 type:complete len:329 (+) Transcript_21378:90-1076(+)